MHAILLIGIQGAGKSTFYQRRFLHSHMCVSLDVVKTRRREALLFAACLEAGQPLVVDNTNVAAEERRRYIAPARAARFRVTGYFFEPDAQGCLARNDARDGRRRVPAAGLFGTLKRLERPLYSEGFDELFRVHIEADGGFLVTPWEET